MTDTPTKAAPSAWAVDAVEQIIIEIAQRHSGIVLAPDIGDLAAIIQDKAITPALAEYQRAVDGLHEAANSAITVLDESSREEMAKQLTDAELGKLWLAVTDQLRTALAAWRHLATEKK